MKYHALFVIFEKSIKLENFRLLQIIADALRVNSLHAEYFFILLLSSADFYFKMSFSNIVFRNTSRVSNGLDPKQDRHSLCFVGPDLCPNCKGYQQASFVFKHTQLQKLAK